MMHILQLSITDFRQILREQLLWVMFFLAPVMQFLIARWLAPVLIDFFPVLDGYQYLIVGLLTVQVVTGIGFVVAMMLLDEKDDGVLTAIRVLPLRPEVFLLYRLLIATFIAWMFGFTMLYFSGLIELAPGKALLSAALFALLSPIVVLFMSSFGENKVEGLAMYKGINLVLTLPVISFFVPGHLAYLFGIIPDFWSFQLLSPETAHLQPVWLLIGIGVFCHLAVLAVLFVQFRERVFK